MIDFAGLAASRAAKGERALSPNAMAVSAEYGESGRGSII